MVIEKKLDEQGMLREDILSNNPFKNCTARELHSYWLALKRLYKEEWDFVSEKDNPLTSILAEKYSYSENFVPDFMVLQMEQDLLRAIACEAFG